MKLQQSPLSSPPGGTRPGRNSLGPVKHVSRPTNTVGKRLAPRGVVASSALLAPDSAQLDAVHGLILSQHAAAESTLNMAVHSEQLAGVISSMQNALQDSGSVYHATNAVMDAASGHADPIDLMHQVTHLTASLPSDALSLSPEMMSMAQQGLQDMASWTDAAVAAASIAGPHVANLQALAVLATERLSALQDIDPESFQVLQGSMNSLLGALNELLTNEAGKSAGQWTTALVLGVQQLVAASRMEEAGGAYGIEAMAEAQNAFTAASKANPIGLEGLVTLTMGVIALILACIPRAADLKSAQNPINHGGDDENVPLRYNQVELAEYWSKRPIVVMQRSTQVVSSLVGFTMAIIFDAKTGQWEKRMPERAAQLRKIVEGLGATCIKIAQAFSTRVDMVPPVYLEELKRLQDNVPTFSTVEARYVLEDGLGRSVDTIFDWLSEEPLAAASLGQVYRGKLRSEYGGAEVAVKVQRPGVVESASLDIFLLRRAAVLFSKIPGMSDQWALALDDWALRFFQEMDYQMEAINTITFKEQMAHLEGIVVATVYPELVSRKVIVSEWIEGEKLSQCKPADIRALCSTFLNCYLIQLMETGLLHADPHPGNLMRTTDGKLVILDFGLMTEITPEHRVGLVEFISHLTIGDWDAIMTDMVTLGFMPTDMDDEARAHVGPVMKTMLGKMMEGGGLGKSGLNFTSLAFQLQGVSMNYQLCIPPYFTNVLRAFSTIEGIALKADPNYAIVNECMPYLSRRLLTDNNPKMRAALRTMLYGDGKRLDVERLRGLISTFSNFSTSSSSGASASSSGATSGSIFGEERVKGSYAAESFAAEGPVLNEMMREALKVVFAKDGSYAQELIVEELVAAVDAMSREALSEALRLVLGSATVVTALKGVEALGPLRAMLMPLPMDMLHSMEPAVQLTKEDRQALSTLRSVLDLLGGGSRQPLSAVSMMQGLQVSNMAAVGGRAVRAAGEVVPMLPDLLPGVQVTLELFTRQLVRRMSLRLAEDLEPGSTAAAAAKSSPARGRGGGAGAAPSKSGAKGKAAFSRRQPY